MHELSSDKMTMNMLIFQTNNKSLFLFLSSRFQYLILILSNSLHCPSICTFSPLILPFDSLFPCLRFFIPHTFFYLPHLTVLFNIIFFLVLTLFLSLFFTSAGGMRLILCVQTCRARSLHATKRMLEKPFTVPT